VRHGRICVKQRRGPSALADILVELRAKVTQNKRAAEAAAGCCCGWSGGAVVLPAWWTGGLRHSWSALCTVDWIIN